MESRASFMYDTFQEFVVRFGKSISPHIRENAQGIRKDLHTRVLYKYTEYKASKRRRKKASTLCLMLLLYN